MGNIYILQLLFSDKSQNWLITQQPLKLEKNKCRFIIFRIFYVYLTKFKTAKCYFLKLARSLVTTKLIIVCNIPIKIMIWGPWPKRADIKR